jgi:hypothetical protein
MNYRQVREAQRRIEEVRRHLHAAILANDTRDMTREAGAAQSTAVEIDRTLEDQVQLSRRPTWGEASNRDLTSSLVDAARASLDSGITCAQRVALGQDVAQLRQGLLDCTTYVDFADAYLQAALGDEAVGA